MVPVTVAEKDGIQVGEIKLHLSAVFNSASLLPVSNRYCLPLVAMWQAKPCSPIRPGRSVTVLSHRIVSCIFIISLVP